MSVTVGELSLVTSIDFSKFDQQFRDINKRVQKLQGSNLTVKTDLSQLHALNDLLDKKQKHLKQTQQYFNQNPLTVQHTKVYQSEQVNSSNLNNNKPQNNVQDKINLEILKELKSIKKEIINSSAKNISSTSIQTNVQAEKSKKTEKINEKIEQNIAKVATGIILSNTGLKNIEKNTKNSFLKNIIKGIAYRAGESVANIAAPSVQSLVSPVLGSIDLFIESVSDIFTSTAQQLAPVFSDLISQFGKSLLLKISQQTGIDNLFFDKIYRILAKQFQGLYSFSATLFSDFTNTDVPYFTEKQVINAIRSISEKIEKNITSPLLFIDQILGENKPLEQARIASEKIKTKQNKKQKGISSFYLVNRKNKEKRTQSNTENQNAQKTFIQDTQNLTEITLLVEFLKKQGTGDLLIQDGVNLKVPELAKLHNLIKRKNKKPQKGNKFTEVQKRFKEQADVIEAELQLNKDKLGLVQSRIDQVGPDKELEKEKNDLEIQQEELQALLNTFTNPNTVNNVIGSAITKTLLNFKTTIDENINVLKELKKTKANLKKEILNAKAKQKKGKKPNPQLLFAIEQQENQIKAIEQEIENSKTNIEFAFIGLIGNTIPLSILQKKIAKAKQEEQELSQKLKVLTAKKNQSKENKTPEDTKAEESLMATLKKQKIEKQKQIKNLEYQQKNALTPNSLTSVEQEQQIDVLTRQKENVRSQEKKENKKEIEYIASLSKTKENYKNLLKIKKNITQEEKDIVLKKIEDLTKEIKTKTSESKKNQAKRKKQTELTLLELDAKIEEAYTAWQENPFTKTIDELTNEKIAKKKATRERIEKQKTGEKFTESPQTVSEFQEQQKASRQKYKIRKQKQQQEQLEQEKQQQIFSNFKSKENSSYKLIIQELNKIAKTIFDTNLNLEDVSVVVDNEALKSANAYASYSASTNEVVLTQEMLDNLNNPSLDENNYTTLIHELVHALIRGMTGLKAERLEVVNTEVMSKVKSFVDSDIMASVLSEFVPLYIDKAKTNPGVLEEELIAESIAKQLTRNRYASQMSGSNLVPIKAIATLGTQLKKFKFIDKIPEQISQIEKLLAQPNLPDSIKASLEQSKTKLVNIQSAIDNTFNTKDKSNIDATNPELMTLREKATSLIPAYTQDASSVSIQDIMILAKNIEKPLNIAQETSNTIDSELNTIATMLQNPDKFVFGKEIAQAQEIINKANTEEFNTVDVSKITTLLKEMVQMQKMSIKIFASKDPKQINDFIQFVKSFKTSKLGDILTESTKEIETTIANVQEKQDLEPLNLPMPELIPLNLPMPELIPLTQTETQPLKSLQVEQSLNENIPLNLPAPDFNLDEELLTLEDALSMSMSKAVTDAVTEINDLVLSLKPEEAVKRVNDLSAIFKDSYKEIKSLYQQKDLKKLQVYVSVLTKMAENAKAEIKQMVSELEARGHNVGVGSSLGGKLNGFIGNLKGAWQNPAQKLIQKLEKEIALNPPKNKQENKVEAVSTSESQPIKNIPISIPESQPIENIPISIPESQPIENIPIAIENSELLQEAKQELQAIFSPLIQGFKNAVLMNDPSLTKELVTGNASLINETITSIDEIFDAGDIESFGVMSTALVEEFENIIGALQQTEKELNLPEYKPGNIDDFNVLSSKIQLLTKLYSLQATKMREKLSLASNRNIESILTPLNISNQPISIPESQPIENIPISIPESQPIENIPISIPESQPIENIPIAIENSELLQEAKQELQAIFSPLIQGFKNAVLMNDPSLTKELVTGNASLINETITSIDEIFDAGDIESFGVMSTALVEEFENIISALQQTEKELNLPEYKPGNIDDFNVLSSKIQLLTKLYSLQATKMRERLSLAFNRNSQNNFENTNEELVFRLKEDDTPTFTNFEHAIQESQQQIDKLNKELQHLTSLLNSDITEAQTEKEQEQTISDVNKILAKYNLPSVVNSEIKNPENSTTLFKEIDTLISTMNSEIKDLMTEIKQKDNVFVDLGKALEIGDDKQIQELQNTLNEIQTKEQKIKDLKEAIFRLEKTEGYNIFKKRQENLNKALKLLSSEQQKQKNLITLRKELLSLLETSTLQQENFDNIIALSNEAGIKLPTIDIMTGYIPDEAIIQIKEQLKSLNDDLAFFDILQKDVDNLVSIATGFEHLEIVDKDQELSLKDIYNTIKQARTELERINDLKNIKKIIQSQIKTAEKTSNIKDIEELNIQLDYVLSKEDQLQNLKDSIKSLEKTKGFKQFAKEVETAEKKYNKLFQKLQKKYNQDSGTVVKIQDRNAIKEQLKQAEIDNDINLITQLNKQLNNINNELQEIDKLEKEVQSAAFELSKVLEEIDSPNLYIAMGDEDEVVNALDEYIDKSEELEEQALSTGNRLKDIGTSLFGIVVHYAGLNKIVDTFAALGREGLTLAGNLEALKLSYDSVFQVGGAENLAKITKQAYANNQNILASRQGYLQLSASLMGTQAADSSFQVFQGVGKYATLLGSSEDAQTRIFTALSQMASKGKVSLEELTGQLGEQLPGALGIAAEAMQMTTKEFIKTVSLGQVSSADFLPKFGALMDSKASADFEKTLNNYNSLFAKLQNQIFLLKEGFGTQLLPVAKFALNILTKLINVLTRDVESSSSVIVALGASMAALSLTKLVNDTNTLFKALFNENALTVLSKTFKKITNSITGTNLGFTSLLKNMGQYLLTMGLIAAATYVVYNVVSGINNIAKAWKDANKEADNYFNKLQEWDAKNKNKNNPSEKREVKPESDNVFFNTVDWIKSTKLGKVLTFNPYKWVGQKTGLIRKDKTWGDIAQEEANIQASNLAMSSDKNLSLLTKNLYNKKALSDFSKQNAKLRDEISNRAFTIEGLQLRSTSDPKEIKEINDKIAELTKENKNASKNLIELQNSFVMNGMKGIDDYIESLKKEQQLIEEDEKKGRIISQSVKENLKIRMKAAEQAKEMFTEALNAEQKELVNVQNQLIRINALFEELGQGITINISLTKVGIIEKEIKRIIGATQSQFEQALVSQQEAFARLTTQQNKKAQLKDLLAQIPVDTQTAIQTAINEVGKPLEEITLPDIEVMLQSSSLQERPEQIQQTLELMKQLKQANVDVATAQEQAISAQLQAMQSEIALRTYNLSLMQLEVDRYKENSLQLNTIKASLEKIKALTKGGNLTLVDIETAKANVEALKKTIADRQIFIQDLLSGKVTGLEKEESIGDVGKNIVNAVNNTNKAISSSTKQIVDAINNKSNNSNSLNNSKPQPKPTNLTQKPTESKKNNSKTKEKIAVKTAQNETLDLINKMKSGKYNGVKINPYSDDNWARVQNTYREALQREFKQANLAIPNTIPDFPNYPTEKNFLSTKKTAKVTKNKNTQVDETEYKLLQKTVNDRVKSFKNNQSIQSLSTNTTFIPPAESLWAENTLKKLKNSPQKSPTATKNVDIAKKIVEANKVVAAVSNTKTLPVSRSLNPTVYKYQIAKSNIIPTNITHPNEKVWQESFNKQSYKLINSQPKTTATPQIPKKKDRTTYFGDEKAFKYLMESVSKDIYNVELSKIKNNYLKGKTDFKSFQTAYNKRKQQLTKEMLILMDTFESMSAQHPEINETLNKLNYQDGYAILYQWQRTRQKEANKYSKDTLVPNKTKKETDQEYFAKYKNFAEKSIVDAINALMLDAYKTQYFYRDETERDPDIIKFLQENKVFKLKSAQTKKSNQTKTALKSYGQTTSNNWESIVSAIIGSQKNLPNLKEDKSHAPGKGAYNRDSNTVSISKELMAKLNNIDSLTSDDIELLAHELRHYQQDKNNTLKLDTDLSVFDKATQQELQKGVNWSVNKWITDFENQNKRKPTKKEIAKITSYEKDAYKFAFLTEQNFLKNPNALRGLTSFNQQLEYTTGTQSQAKTTTNISDLVKKQITDTLGAQAFQDLILGKGLGAGDINKLLAVDNLAPETRAVAEQSQKLNEDQQRELEEQLNILTELNKLLKLKYAVELAAIKAIKSNTEYLTSNRANLSQINLNKQFIQGKGTERQLTLAQTNLEIKNLEDKFKSLQKVLDLSIKGMTKFPDASLKQIEKAIGKSVKPITTNSKNAINDTTIGTGDIELARQKLELYLETNPSLQATLDGLDQILQTKSEFLSTYKDWTDRELQRVKDLSANTLLNDLLSWQKSFYESLRVLRNTVISMRYTLANLKLDIDSTKIESNLFDSIKPGSSNKARDILTQFNQREQEIINFKKQENDIRSKEDTLYTQEQQVQTAEQLLDLAQKVNSQTSPMNNQGLYATDEELTRAIEKQYLETARKEGREPNAEELRQIKNKYAENRQLWKAQMAIANSSNDPRQLMPFLTTQGWQKNFSLESLNELGLIDVKAIKEKIKLGDENARQIRDDIKLQKEQLSENKKLSQKKFVDSLARFNIELEKENITLERNINDTYNKVKEWSNQNFDPNLDLSGYETLVKNVQDSKNSAMAEQRTFDDFIRERKEESDNLIKSIANLKNKRGTVKDPLELQEIDKSIAGLQIKLNLLTQILGEDLTGATSKFAKAYQNWLDTIKVQTPLQAAIKGIKELSNALFESYKSDQDILFSKQAEYAFGDITKELVSIQQSQIEYDFKFNTPNFKEEITQRVKSAIESIQKILNNPDLQSALEANNGLQRQNLQKLLTLYGLTPEAQEKYINTLVSSIQAYTEAIQKRRIATVEQNLAYLQNTGFGALENVKTGLGLLASSQREPRYEIELLNQKNKLLEIQQEYYDNQVKTQQQVLTLQELYNQGLAKNLDGSLMDEQDLQKAVNILKEYPNAIRAIKLDQLAMDAKWVAKEITTMVESGFSNIFYDMFKFEETGAELRQQLKDAENAANQDGIQRDNKRVAEIKRKLDNLFLVHLGNLLKKIGANVLEQIGQFASKELASIAFKGLFKLIGLTPKQSEEAKKAEEFIKTLYEPMMQGLQNSSNLVVEQTTALASALGTLTLNFDNAATSIADIVTRLASVYIPPTTQSQQSIPTNSQSNQNRLIDKNQNQNLITQNSIVNSEIRDNFNNKPSTTTPPIIPQKYPDPNITDSSISITPDYNQVKFPTIVGQINNRDIRVSDLVTRQEEQKQIIPSPEEIKKRFDSEVAYKNNMFYGVPDYFQNRNTGNIMPFTTFNRDKVQEDVSFDYWNSKYINDGIRKRGTIIEGSLSAEINQAVDAITLKNDINSPSVTGQTFSKPLTSNQELPLPPTVTGQTFSKPLTSNQELPLPPTVTGQTFSEPLTSNQKLPLPPSFPLAETVETKSSNNNSTIFPSGVISASTDYSQKVADLKLLAKNNEPLPVNLNIAELTKYLYPDLASLSNDEVEQLLRENKDVLTEMVAIAKNLLLSLGASGRTETFSNPNRNEARSQQFIRDTGLGQNDGEIIDLGTGNLIDKAQQPYQQYEQQKAIFDESFKRLSEPSQGTQSNTQAIKDYSQQTQNNTQYMIAGLQNIAGLLGNSISSSGQGGIGGVLLGIAGSAVSSALNIGIGGLFGGSKGPKPNSNTQANGAIGIAYNGGEVGKLNTYFDGGSVNGTVQNLANGGKVGGMNLVEAVNKAVKRERAAGGNPRLVVASKGEEILSTKKGDAQFFRMLKESGQWNQLKKGEIPTYNNGGSIGTSYISPQRNVITNNKSGNTNSVNINVYAKDVNSFRRSESQIQKDMSRQLNRSRNRNG